MLKYPIKAWHIRIPHFSVWISGELVKLDTLLILVPEDLGLATFDQDIQGLEHHVWIHAMEF